MSQKTWDRFDEEAAREGDARRVMKEVAPSAVGKRTAKRRRVEEGNRRFHQTLVEKDYMIIGN